MLKSELQPSAVGPRRNPVLHGVANGLAKLFPPVEQPGTRARDADARREPAPAPRD